MQKSNKLTESGFWYKARHINPEFKIGGESYWEYSNNNFLNEERNNEDDFSNQKKKKSSSC